MQRDIGLSRETARGQLLEKPQKAYVAHSEPELHESLGANQSASATEDGSMIFRHYDLWGYKELPWRAWTSLGNPGRQKSGVVTFCDFH